MNRSFPLPQGAVALEPAPDASVERSRAGFWQARDKTPIVSLTDDPELLRPGWVLIRGFVHADIREATLLHIERRDGSVLKIKIPVTARGKVQETIQLPRDCCRLTLQPVAHEGEFELAGFSLQRLTWLDSVVRRAWRVHKTKKKYPRRMLRLLGWPWHSPWLNLARAHEVANNLRDHLPHTSYARYLATVDTLARDDRKLITRHIRSFPYRPRFRIFLSGAGQNEADTNATLLCLEKQLYGDFYVEADSALPFEDASGKDRWFSVPNLAEHVSMPLPDTKPEWIIFLRAGECLAETALYWLAAYSLEHPEVEFIYTDHDHREPDGSRHSPIFKPDWSPELLRCANYIGASAAIRQDSLARLGRLPSMHAGHRHGLWLRLTHDMPPGAIGHIPAILWHLPPHPAPHWLAAHADLDTVNEHLRSIGVQAQAFLSRWQKCRVRYALPSPAPRVSIIVPTRDGLRYLRPCIESVRTRSTYPDIEILVMDNGSKDPDTLAYLQVLQADARVKVMRDDSPFNYSRLNNSAAQAATGQILCLLNNDTEVITSDWLEEMVGHLCQPGVGVVGAKLYYGDGRVQHAGDAVGPGGCADHYHSKIARDDPGYAGRAVLAQDLSAVTGACLLTWRGLFLDLGGLNETELAVSFNDVDYCLRVREAGQRVVWTPHAELFHYESLTRGGEFSAEQQARGRREADYIRTRWAAIMKHEPFYNPNLSYDRPDFTLNPSPALPLPWKPR